MATTVLTGALGVEDVLAGKDILDVTPGLQHLYKDISPLFRVFNALPKGPTATNEKIIWTQKDLVPKWDTLTTDVGASASAGATVTLIPTGDGTSKTAHFGVYDLVEVPGRPESSGYSNIGRVTTVTANTSIVVDPIGWVSDSIAGTEKKFVATFIGDEIHRISNASEEYSQKPAMKVTKDVQAWNYIQFLRAPYIVGNINMDKKKYTGPERAERREETYKDVRIQAEDLLIHGKRYYVDGTNGRQFFMQGIKRYLVDGAGDNLLTNWSAGLNESQLDEYLVKGPGMYGSTTKLWFLSSDLFLKINELAKNKERIMGQVEKFGLTFTKYLAPDNVTYLMYRHHGFTNAYAGAGLIVDPMYARIRPYGTQGTMRLLTNIQENDRAGIADEWQIIFSLEVDRIEPHGWQTA
jgi:hypothetical protein